MGRQSPGKYLRYKSQMNTTSILENPRPLEESTFIQRWHHTRKRLDEVCRGTSQESGGTIDTSLMVSVMVVTYNHEKYIGQAIESVLMQERDFEIEINIIDDCSTDRTQEIVAGYQQRYPALINCYFNEHNVGHIATQLNTFRGFQTLRGKYFALLEGDDYWTSSQKLKKQVEFLEGNQEYVACAHDVLKVFDDGRPPEHFLPFKAFGRNRATMLDLVNMAGVFHLSSIVYRNKFGLNPPQCLADPYSCEVVINMLYGQFGDFYCMNEYMSAYRVHNEGVFSTRSLEGLWLFHIHGYRRFSLYMGHKYWRLFSRAVIGFSRYVLSAHRKCVCGRLKIRTKAIFLSHLAIAMIVFPVMRIIDILPGRRQTQCSALSILSRRDLR